MEMSTFNRSQSGQSVIWYAVLLVAIVLVVGAFLFGVTVDEGQRCTVTVFGRMSDTADPGWHLRWPLITAYRCFSVREVVYETSDQPNESQADYTDFAVPGQTSDGQQVSVKYSIRFSADPNHVGDIYKTVAQNMR